MSWLINNFYDFCKGYFCVLSKKNDGNSLHYVIVLWKYRSLLYVVFWLIFKSYLKCTTSSYQMSSGRHAFQTFICSLIGFNSYFVLYLMCCFGNNLCIWISNQCKFCSVIGRLIAIYRHFQQLHTYCIRRKPVLLLVEIRILYKSTELTRQ